MRALLLLFVILHYARVSEGILNLFISGDETNRTIGMSTDLNYIDAGEVNNYAAQFPFRIDAHIHSLHFTWQAKKPIEYTMRVESEASVVMPSLRIPRSGTVPMTPKEFVVDYRCVGAKSGQFEVNLFIDFLLPSGNRTSLRLRQEKICARMDTRGKHQQVEEVVPGESEWISAEDVFYVIIGVAAAFLALIAFLLVLYFRSTRKSDAPSIRSRLPASFRSPSTRPSHQPFLTSTPLKAASTPRPIPPSSSPIIERSHVIDVKQSLIELYADRNLFQQMPFVELEGTFGEMKWAIWRQTADGVCGDIDEEEDAGTAEEAVILKTLKTGTSQAQFEKFLRDALVFHHVPPQPNLAQVAAAASFGRFENPETISDFPLICYKHRGFGILYRFLLSCRNGEETRKRSKGGSSSGGGAPPGALPMHELVSIALQIGRAVNHLHTYGILHKDIATRNCLVSELTGLGKSDRLLVQVMDNALAKDFFPSHYACLGDNDNRPIRWMAPETLSSGATSSASDVWMFGVTMWELMSCALMPFEDINAEEILTCITQGDRLPQPYGCPDQVYNIMLSTWQLHPRDRPSAKNLLTTLVEVSQQLKSFV